MAIFTRIMDRMVMIGWLHHYTFTDDIGFDLAWTWDGALNARLLGIVIKHCRLEEGDEDPLMFDKLAHGESLPDGRIFTGQINEGLKKWWRDGVAALGLRGDEDGLISMVHLIRHWKPDRDTPIWPEEGPR